MLTSETILQLLLCLTSSWTSVNWNLIIFVWFDQSIPYLSWSLQSQTQTTKQNCMSSEEAASAVDKKSKKNAKLKNDFKLALKFVLATEGTDPRVTQLVQLNFYKYFKYVTQRLKKICSTFQHLLYLHVPIFYSHHSFLFVFSLSLSLSHQSLALIHYYQASNHWKM